MALLVRKPLPTRPADPAVGTCPSCGGTVHSGSKKFYCINNRHDECDFFMRKKKVPRLGKENITDAEMSNLLKGKTINLYNVKSKEGKLFNTGGTLEYDENWGWKIEFGAMVPNSTPVVRTVPLPILNKK